MNIKQKKNKIEPWKNLNYNEYIKPSLKEELPFLFSLVLISSESTLIEFLPPPGVEPCTSGFTGIPRYHLNHACHNNKACLKFNAYPAVDQFQIYRNKHAGVFPGETGAIKRIVDVFRLGNSRFNSDRRKNHTWCGQKKTQNELTPLYLTSGPLPNAANRLFM